MTRARQYATCRRALAAWALSLACLFLFTAAEVGSPGFPPPNACERAGLIGTCSGCVCCCGEAPGKLPTLTPDGCVCVNEALDRLDKATRNTVLAAGAAAIVVPALLALAWFGRCCCGSPYEADRWEAA
jgi:hypothetical protein